MLCVQVLAVLLVLLAFALLRKVKSPAQTVAVAGAAATAAAAAAAAATSTKGTKGPGTAAQAAAAAAGAVVVASSASRSSGGWRLLPVQPPPVMWNPSYALPDDSQQTGALPTDPYTSLKQNYEAVIGFLTLVREMACCDVAGRLSAGSAAAVAGLRVFGVSTEAACCLVGSAARCLLAICMQQAAAHCTPCNHAALRECYSPPSSGCGV